MGSIAKKYGFHKWQELWNLPQNLTLRTSGRKPELLVSGDIVFIPERTIKETAAQTDARHRFVLEAAVAELHLRFVDVEPYIHAFGAISYSLEAKDGNNQSGTITKEKQEITMPLNLAAETCTLMIGGMAFQLSIGSLDPLETVSGIQGRLKNLGFDPGPITNTENPSTTSAVRAFQEHYKITVNGTIGPEVQHKMKEVYGC